MTIFSSYIEDDCKKHESIKILNIYTIVIKNSASFNFYSRIIVVTNALWLIYDITKTIIINNLKMIAPTNKYTIVSAKTYDV